MNTKNSHPAFIWPVYGGLAIERGGRILKRANILIGLALVAALAVVGAVLAGKSRGGIAIDPSQFSARVDNEWFPLVPGTTYVYVGLKDGKPARDVVTVTHRTITIAGVPCVVIEDRLYLSGRLRERTTDWYTQDRKGNVWYFGERTAELDEHGRVASTEGSWKAGTDGAKPGIFMSARPQVGQSYREEFYKGHAEDYFRVVGLFGSVTGRRTPNGLLTEEWTPLEPNVLDHKLYNRGVGTVVERSVKGGNEYLELVSLRRGG
jgi:hypothetical protein